VSSWPLESHFKPLADPPIGCRSEPYGSSEMNILIRHILSLEQILHATETQTFFPTLIEQMSLEV
jgi:hypothetical protein